VPTGIRRIGARSSRTGGFDVRVNVNVAVIDTGIQHDHPDLNVSPEGRNFADGSVDGLATPWDDDNGHGTHVAGTIAALDNSIGVVGVAPGARLYAVKVLDNQGSGYTSRVIAGIDWVASTRTDLNPDNNIAVANMSLGGGSDTAMLDALDGAVAAGVVFTVAAGNSTADCRGTSPANSTSYGVITVSALADNDGRSGGLGGSTGYGADDWIATFSNNGRNEAVSVSDRVGDGVDAIAPGVSIYSTYMGGGYATMSGTSMATPHAAGVAALYVAGHPGASPGEIKLNLLESSPGWGYYTYSDGLDYIFGTLPWRAINGDYDSGYSTIRRFSYMDDYGYEPLVDAASF
jgi:subtilisin family serine protease